MTTLRAPAKLTTELRVVGTRPDGMHLIDAEMVILDLVDRLEVTAAPVDGRSRVVDANGETRPDDDLVYRALELVGRSATVSVTKEIPARGGLGGGSADAAAILRWAGYADVVGAAGIGADVAFCLIGGRARVSGIGEVIEPRSFEARAYTLLTPPFGCSTPEVYRAWDELGGPTGANGNDLEPAAIRVAPELSVYRDRLANRTGSVPRLAGSGSTWFVEGAFEGPGLVVVRTDQIH